ncbi:succinoglycan biosynthesis protein exoI [Mesorhizobium sp. LNHC252B00]|uniref:sunset domain-containing protein n=1 Tax=Mesorhizobium sp. LNHC252B00 TaxID=1287252 RepID=UPI0003CEF6F7|nr:hypothetical protein [Mesorhizobium sp. LNHC252B00]ESY72619.1 succinoglycan biosynthesis protein exoI [Mesorhizobium sp. LNHC252B00]
MGDPGPWGKIQPRKHRIPFGWMLVAAFGGVAAGNYFWWNSSNLMNVVSAFGSTIGCDIKGNISINSGQRIYHMPGQEFYSRTIIRPEFGERWFCSEAEAQAAGWRRAKW